MKGINAQDITGLILAGGRGSRMGGVDKGLQNHRGLPLALHALKRLQGQVGHVMISANRNLATYEAMGVPVWPDPMVAVGAAGALGEFPGPLAGWMAALRHCETPYLLTVPCDTPQFPLDLAARLSQALLADDADIAMAACCEDGKVQLQPVFCLFKATLGESLLSYLTAGQRKIERWTALHRRTSVVFDDPQAFFNANTADELQSLQRPGA